MFELTTEQEQNIVKALAFARELPGVRVELVGAWVWVNGNTKPHRESLKAAGFRWAPKKERWYFAGVPSSGRGRDMLSLRAKYGYELVKDEL